MDFEKITQKTREAFDAASAYATRYSAAAVNDLHLAAALIDDAEGVACSVISALTDDKNALREKLILAILPMLKLLTGHIHTLVGQPKQTLLKV